jgi:hypothetical protein
MSTPTEPARPKQPAPPTVAEQARALAERIKQLPRVVAASFVFADPDERVRRLQHIEAELSAGAVPLLSWLERRRPPDKAELLKRRLFEVLENAVRCVRYDIPEYAGGAPRDMGREHVPSEGARATAELVVVPAHVIATDLMGWAEDIDAEESRPAASSAADKPAPAGLADHLSDDDPTLPEFMSAADLARHLGEGVNAVETFLRRYRRDHEDCYRQDHEEMPRRNEPRFLYRTRDVLPALRGRKRRPSRRTDDGRLR